MTSVTNMDDVTETTRQRVMTRKLLVKGGDNGRRLGALGRTN